MGTRLDLVSKLRAMAPRVVRQLQKWQRFAKESPRNDLYALTGLFLAMIVSENVVALAGSVLAMRVVGLPFLVGAFCTLLLGSSSWRWWMRALTGGVILLVFANPTPAGLVHNATNLLIWLAVALLIAGALAVLVVLAGRKPTHVKRGLNSHVNADGSPKRGYATRIEAQAMAERLSAKDGARMSVYHCASCPEWHVGHAK